MDIPFLIIGLGNPGREYERTRHNAGFLLTDRLADDWHGVWQTEKKFRSRVARADTDGGRVLLVQPQTYMNVSGEAVGPVQKFYRVPPEKMLVAVDDADLPLGSIRLRPGGSSGGHHGLESVEQHIGTRDYPRLRLGIGRTDREKREIAGHVLGRFSVEEWALFEKVLEQAVRQVNCWLREGAESAMSQFNGPMAGQNTKE